MGDRHTAKRPPARASRVLTARRDLIARLRATPRPRAEIIAPPAQPPVAAVRAAAAVAAVVAMAAVAVTRTGTVSPPAVCLRPANRQRRDCATTNLNPRLRIF